MSLKHVARQALVALAAAAPAAALAQPEPCAKPASFRASVGLSQNDRADAAINGAQYQGRGLQVSVGASANVGRVCVAAFATGGTHYLRPINGPFASERLLDGRADLRVLRPVATSSDDRAALALGVATQASLTTTEHSFGDASHRSHYHLRVGSIGLAVDASYRIAGGRAHAGAGIPLVSVVDHPYVATSPLDPAPRLRVATWPSLRGGTGALTYERSISRIVSAGLSYQINGLRYDDARPVRTLSQMLAFDFRFTRPATRG